MFTKTPHKPKQSLTFLTPSTHFKDSQRLSIKSVDTSRLSHSSTRDQSKFWLEEGELTLFEGFGHARSASYEDDDEAEQGPKLKWCAYCKGERATESRYEATEKTFWSSIAIFLAGGVCGCFIAPYYIDDCQKRIEVCNKCRRPL